MLCCRLCWLDFVDEVVDSCVVVVRWCPVFCVEKWMSGVIGVHVLVSALIRLLMVFFSLPVISFLVGF